MTTPKPARGEGNSGQRPMSANGQQRIFGTGRGKAASAKRTKEGGLGWREYPTIKLNACDEACLKRLHFTLA
jgi:hypothetical protein